ncbi:MAG: hypothetical protein AB1409_08170 [Pseudomonadota bacterium]
MPKVLIIEDCLVNYGDDRGGVHESAGALVDVSKDAAAALIRANRALYTDKKDDPDKSGRNTATKDMLQAAMAMAKAGAEKKSEA